MGNIIQLWKFYEQFTLYKLFIFGQQEEPLYCFHFLLFFFLEIIQNISFIFLTFNWKSSLNTFQNRLNSNYVELIYIVHETTIPISGLAFVMKFIIFCFFFLASSTICRSDFEWRVGQWGHIEFFKYNNWLCINFLSLW